MEAEAAQAAPMMQPTAPDAAAHVAAYETPEQSGEAPAEFALFDAFADDDEPAAAEQPAETAREFAEPAEPDLLSVLQVDLPHVEASQESATPAVQASSVQSEPPSASDHADKDLPASERHHPLRFMWLSDRDGRFSIGSEQFLKLIGPLTESLVDRPWREIASTLGILRPNFVAMLDGLESRELCVRMRSTSDRRSHVLVLTDKGRAMLARAKKLVAGKHEARLDELLGSANRAALIAMLTRIANEF